MRMLRTRSAVFGASLLAFAVLAAACGGAGGDGTDTGEQPKGTLIVGVSGALPENQVVAEMYAQVLENAGYTVERQLDLGTREISDAALFSGEIDLKPEYTGYEIPALDPDGDAEGTPDEVYETMRELYAEEGVTALAFSPANSTNAFVVTQETADEHGLQAVSDLAPVAGDLTLGGPPECPDRPFCILGLKDVYGVEFGDFRALDFGGARTEQALEAGAIDVALLFSLNPNIEANGWIALEDDENLQVPGNFVAVVRDEAMNEELPGLLDPVTESLTNELMLDLVNRIANEHEDVEEVAASHLESAGLA